MFLVSICKIVRDRDMAIAYSKAVMNGVQTPVIREPLILRASLEGAIAWIDGVNFNNLSGEHFPATGRLRRPYHMPWWLEVTEVDPETTDFPPLPCLYMDWHGDERDSKEIPSHLFEGWFPDTGPYAKHADYSELEA